MLNSYVFRACGCMLHVLIDLINIAYQPIVLIYSHPEFTCRPLTYQLFASASLQKHSCLDWVRLDDVLEQLLNLFLMKWNTPYGTRSLAVSVRSAFAKQSLLRVMGSASRAMVRAWRAQLVAQSRNWKARKGWRMKLLLVETLKHSGKFNLIGQTLNNIQSWRYLLHFVSIAHRSSFVQMCARDVQPGATGTDVTWLSYLMVMFDVVGQRAEGKTSGRRTNDNSIIVQNHVSQTCPDMFYHDSLALES